jgi:hypothetical protein
VTAVWKQIREWMAVLKGRQAAQQQQSSGQPTRGQILWIGGGMGVLIVLIIIGYRFGVTLWDWAQLLIVPAVIAGGGIWFNNEQKARDREREEQQKTREQEIAEQRAQQEALQAYLDHISEQLLGRDPPHSASLRMVARAQTLALLGGARTFSDSAKGLLIVGGLDPTRKGELVRFLYEADLIMGESPVISLNKANLAKADLSDWSWEGINLAGASLVSACLERAGLQRAILTGADLTAANVTDEQLTLAQSLEGATMPDGSIHD